LCSLGLLYLLFFLCLHFLLLLWLLGEVCLPARIPLPPLLDTTQMIALVHDSGGALLAADDGGGTGEGSHFEIRADLLSQSQFSDIGKSLTGRAVLCLAFEIEGWFEIISANGVADSYSLFLIGNDIKTSWVDESIVFRAMDFLQVKGLLGESVAIISLHHVSMTVSAYSPYQAW